MTSAAEPAVLYGSSRVPFNFNVGVTPIRKLLEDMGREIPSQFALSTKVTLTKLVAPSKKIRMKDMIFHFIGTCPVGSYAFLCTYI
jgi:hypothetical protein